MHFAKVCCIAPLLPIMESWLDNLFAKGADVNAVDDTGLTPLFLACGTSLGIAQALLAEGANIRSARQIRTLRTTFRNQESVCPRLVIAATSAEARAMIEE